MVENKNNTKTFNELEKSKKIINKFFNKKKQK